MEARCDGEIILGHAHWECAACGYTSSSWDTSHPRLLTRAQNFVATLATLAREADENAGAATAAS